jgi:flagellar basal body-associated protein FliL
MQDSGGEPAGTNQTLPEPSEAPVETDTSENSTMSEPVTDQPVQAQPAPVIPAVTDKKRSKKPLIIGLIAAVVLALLAGGYLVFALVYNSPENAVNDALSKVLRARDSEGEIRMHIEQDRTTIEMKSKYALNDTGEASADFTASVNARSQSVELEGGVANTKEDTYVRVKGIRDYLMDMATASGATEEQVDAAYGSLLDKIENKWVVITADDLTRWGSEEQAKQLKCVQEQSAKFSTDTSSRYEMVNIYKKNPFLLVKGTGTESVAGVVSNRYEVRVDINKLKSLARAFQETKAFQAVDECTDGEFKKDFMRSIEDMKASDFDDTKFELWVSPFSHDITKFRMSPAGKSKASGFIEVLPKFDTRPKVTIPKADTTVDDLMVEFQKLQGMTGSPRPALPTNTY